MIYKKLVLSFFPKIYWVLLIIGILARTSDNLIVLSNVILNLIALFFFIRIGVVLHEIGHLVCAKLAGGTPKRMILGYGHEIIRFNLFNIKTVINESFKGGAAIASFKHTDFLKLRYLFYVSGGIITNFLFFYLFLQLFGLNLNQISAINGIDLPSAFIISNAVLVIIGLIPGYVYHQGIKMPNDALTLIKIPFMTPESLKQNLNVGGLFDALEFFEDKKFDKAIKIYESHLDEEQNQILIKVNLSIMYLKKELYDKSIELLKSCENNELDKTHKAFVSNSLAWLYLIKKDIKNADNYSKIAVSLNQKEKNFKGTRGSVLIEKGEIKQGIKLLTETVDFNFPNNQTIAASMYLTYAFHLKKDQENKIKHLDFVTANLNVLDADEVSLWNDIKGKIEKNS